MTYRFLARFLSLVVLLGPPILPAATAPQPNEARVAWEIDIRYRAPQPIVVKVPGYGSPQRFWYFLYTVTNQSGEDRHFAPDIVLYTNTGQIVRSGEGVNTTVYQTIKQRHNDPLLQTTVGMAGKLLQGESNAKEGVAIFRDFDPQAASFTLFFGGLSGETARVHLPTPITVSEMMPGGKTQDVSRDIVTLTKTLALTYNVGTEAGGRTQAEIREVDARWVMR